MDEGAGVTADSSQNLLLAEYENTEVSLVKLAKTLLSGDTLPHIFLIIIWSIILYSGSSIDGFIEIIALIFISLSLGYTFTALFYQNKIIKQWNNAKHDVETDKTFVKAVILKFRICTIPLAFALLAFFLLYICFNEDGFIPAGLEFLPLALGSLFVFWSIIQGTSFSQWASSNSAKYSPTSNKHQNLLYSTMINGTLIVSSAIVSAAIFYKLDDFDKTIVACIVSSLPFALIAGVVYAASIRYSWKIKILTSMKSKLHSFSNRWSLICHLFVSWHLLTIWRQNFMGPTRIQLFIEEIFLMIFTVFIAIWSMTAKGYKSNLKLINEENALSWGLAFGYAYAGSVAMLTNIFEDISVVMQVGHAVVILTVLFVHRKVLHSVVDKDNIEVEVKRIITDNLSEKTDNLPTETSLQNSDGNINDTWQEDRDVDWETRPDPNSIDDVDWEEVIELD